MGLIHGSDVRTRSGPAPAIYDGGAPAASRPSDRLWLRSASARWTNPSEGASVPYADCTRREGLVKPVVPGLVARKGADRRPDGPRGLGCSLVHAR